MSPRLLSALLLALVLVLAGCGGGAADDPEGADDTDTPAADEDTPIAGEGEVDEEALQRVVEAAQNTLGEGTARFDITIETSGTAGDDGQQPVSASGEEDFDNQQRRLTFEGPQGNLEMLVDGSEVYVEMPAAEDEQWVRVDLDELLQEDVGFGGPAGVPAQNPRDNLQILEAAAASAQEAGEEDIEGETTTRYELTIDLQQAAEESGPDAEEAIERTRRSTGVDTFDMEVWVDGEDLIRRVAYQLDLGQAEVEEGAEEGEVEADPEGQVVVTIDYHDFGAAVDLELPEEERVVDLDEEELRRTFEEADQAGDA